MQTPTKRGQQWGLLINNTWILYPTEKKALKAATLRELEKKKKKLVIEISALDGQAAESPLDAAAASYVDSLKARNLRPNYIHKVSMTLKHNTRDTTMVNVSDITQIRMNTILNTLTSGLHAKKDYVKVTKAMLYWCRANQIKINDSALLVKPPQVDQEEQRLLTELEIGAIQLEASKFDTTERLTLAYRFMAAFGPRPSELCNLKISDLNQGNGLLTIPGTIAKTRKPRSFPIGQQWMDLLKKVCLIDTRPSNESLLINCHGRIFTWIYLASNFKIMAKRAHVKDLDNIRLYHLRHYAATNIFIRTLDMKAVTTILGHGYSLSQKVYQHRDQNTMIALADKLFAG
jgi:integrase